VFHFVPLFVGLSPKINYLGICLRLGFGVLRFKGDSKGIQRFKGNSRGFSRRFKIGLFVF